MYVIDQSIHKESCVSSSDFDWIRNVGIVLEVRDETMRNRAARCSLSYFKMAKYGAVRNLVWNEERFKEGLEFVKKYYRIENMFEDQVKALRCFFQGKNLYFSAPTGYGKSLIF